MPGEISYDAVVVGSGPNGLAAAIRLAQAKLAVLVLEANPTIGGSARSAELTLTGYVHDVCSAIHPLGIGSPFFRQLNLEHYGLHWIQPELPLAHPLDGDRAVVLRRSVSETAAELGADRKAYVKLFSPFARNCDKIAPDFLKPLLRVPRHPLLMARFGWHALHSAARLAASHFSEEPARALFAGMAAHSFLRLDEKGAAAFGLVLGMLGHAVGWPLPRGGSQAISNALAAHLRALGGEIITSSRVTNIDDLPLARAVLPDLTPRQVLAVAGHKVPERYREQLERYRYGPGVFKMDFALSAPIPWRAETCRRAGTIHLGGTLAEIAASEQAVGEGRHPEKPFVILAQPTVFDDSRAPAGKHIAWAYCHVPNDSSFDMRERIEAQIERFAPGFGNCILARRCIRCAELNRYNPNMVGGDINGGAADLRQLVARPIFSPNPYRTPDPGIYICSASTPPGGGVHGMCGFHAAGVALKDGCYG